MPIMFYVECSVRTLKSVLEREGCFGVCDAWFYSPMRRASRWGALGVELDVPTCVQGTALGSFRRGQILYHTVANGETSIS